MRSISLEELNELNKKLAKTKFYGKVQPCYEYGVINVIKVELTLKASNISAMIKMLS